MNSLIIIIQTRLYHFTFYSSLVLHNMDSITTIKRGVFLVSMVVLAKNWQKLAIYIKLDLKVPLKKKLVSLIFDLFLEK